MACPPSSRSVCLSMNFRLVLLLSVIIRETVQSLQTTGSKLVHRTDLGDDVFDAIAFYQNPQPVLISNALSESDCEVCAEGLLAFQESTMVELQHQKEESTNVYETTLKDALDAILFESSTRDSYLTFAEGLVVDTEIQQVTTRAREKFFSSDRDWFAHYFPPLYRPTDAVVFAGVGSTSTLHRDPFEWMGTSLCVEGSKVWRFVDPKNNVEEIDALLESYRLESMAWEESTDGVSLSAGWQSNKSLFRKRKHEKIPSLQALESMDSSAKANLLARIGSDVDILTPDESISKNITFTTVLQQAGDLLLIPPHWWHQTIGLEPSASIASQRCGLGDAPLVLQHMLDWNGVSMDIQGLSKLDPQSAVDEVLRRCGSKVEG